MITNHQKACLQDVGIIQKLLLTHRIQGLFLAEVVQEIPEDVVVQVVDLVLELSLREGLSMRVEVQVHVLDYFPPILSFLGLTVAGEDELQNILHPFPFSPVFPNLGWAFFFGIQQNFVFNI